MEVREQENAISVRDVTKVYRLYDKPIDRLKESMSISHKNYHRDFYALSGLSFQVKKGETVGIIGTNGSGKSTILKIITGVLTPTTGQVDVNGKISALLELGAGFNMDYTGIENIYMNGTMMGYTKKEMDAKLQDILDFAEIGDFVYQPVKTYSSGMFVRLAFALAINVDPEILIVDEALSVGDVFFQSKCYRRMEEIRKKGTTILMVTHDMGSIIKYCDRVVLLHKGEFIAEGPAGKVVDMYKKILAGKLEELKAERDVENVVMLMPGSHTHGIYIQGDQITGIISNFTGELFYALKQDTILSPVLTSDSLELDEAMVRKGIENLERFGFNRALYICHAMRIFEQGTPQQRLSYGESVIMGGVRQSLEYYCEHFWKECRTVALVSDEFMYRLFSMILEGSRYIDRIIWMPISDGKSYGVSGLKKIVSLKGERHE